MTFLKVLREGMYLRVGIPQSVMWRSVCVKLHPSKCHVKEFMCEMTFPKASCEGVYVWDDIPQSVMWRSVCILVWLWNFLLLVLSEAGCFCPYDSLLPANEDNNIMGPKQPNQSFECVQGLSVSIDSLPIAKCSNFSQIPSLPSSKTKKEHTHFCISACAPCEQRTDRVNQQEHDPTPLQMWNFRSV